MRKLADRIGIAQSVIYHHFENKDILLRYIFDSTNRKLGKKRAKLPIMKNSSDMMRQRVEFQLDNAEEIVAVLKYYLAFRKTFPKVDSGYVPEKTSLHIEEVLERGVKSGEFIPMDIAKEASCDILSFSPFATQDHMFASFLPSQEEERQVVRRLAYIKRKMKRLPMEHTIDTALFRYKIGGAVWEKLPCYIGWLHARIKPDGSVLPCNSHRSPLGNLNASGLEHIWNAEGFRLFRKQSMSRDGLAKIASRFDCYFCCHVSDNARVHKRYRWIAPFLKKIPESCRRRVWRSCKASSVQL